MKPLIRAAVLAAAALSTSVVISQVENKTAQTKRFPQFENDTVKVWKTVVLPNQPLAMHHHDHPRVIIALTGGTTNIVDPSGASETTIGKPARPTGSPPCPQTRSTPT